MKYQNYQQHLKAGKNRKPVESRDKKLKPRQLQGDKMVEANGVKRWPEETDEY